MVNVLDQQDRIKEVDRSNMLGDMLDTPDYCRDAIKRAKQVIVPEGVNPKNIVVVGMGGSAIGGEILHDWLRDTLPIPIEVCRDYTLPAYVNKDTPVTSGGQLEAFCKKLRVPHTLIPSGLQPRVAIPYMFFPLPVLMQNMGVISDIDDELEEAIQALEKAATANAPDVPTRNNKAKQFATELMENIPVVYGFSQYSSIAQRLKAQFNENSKVPSKHEVFSELNHNETVGYDAPESLTKKLSIILIRDQQEPPEIRNRIETTKNLVFGRASKVLEIWAEGKGKLARMLSVMGVGDFASVYLAILQNKDPTPVKIIDRVKSELAKKTRMKERFEAELAKLK
jgi:glucose/mannose-6-phosphate isomerase